MRIFLDEQDVIDAVCVYVADRFGGVPEQARAELTYDENDGIAAEAAYGDRSLRLSEQDLIDCAAGYLASYHRFDPRRLSVELTFEPDVGIGAHVEIIN